MLSPNRCQADNFRTSPWGSRRSRSNARWTENWFLNIFSRRPCAPEAAIRASLRTPFGSAIRSTALVGGSPNAPLPDGDPATSRMETSSRSSHASVILIGTTATAGPGKFRAAAADATSSKRGEGSRSSESRCTKRMSKFGSCPKTARSRSSTLLPTPGKRSAGRSTTSTSDPADWQRLSRCLASGRSDEPSAMNRPRRITQPQRRAP